jgi:hypothetical protein
MAMKLITYNFKEIYNKSKGNLNKLIRLLYEIDEGKYKSLRYRSSYILNFRPLVENRDKATENEILVYLHLTSLRSIHDYMTTKRTDLDLKLAAVYYKPELLKQNRLLIIENETVKFKYEKGEI